MLKCPIHSRHIPVSTCRKLSIRLRQDRSVAVVLSLVITAINADTRLLFEACSFSVYFISTGIELSTNALDEYVCRCATQSNHGCAAHTCHYSATRKPATTTTLRDHLLQGSRFSSHTASNDFFRCSAARRATLQIDARHQAAHSSVNDDAHRLTQSCSLRVFSIVNHLSLACLAAVGAK